MIIMGIDPSLTATGYGIIEFNQKKITILEAGFISPKPKDLFENRLNKIHNLLGEMIDECRPEVLVLEKLYAHHKHPLTASILGHARGVICLLCAQKNIKLVEESAKRIRKAVTGNGNASKIQTRRVVSHVLKVAESSLTLDASDALALALGYVHIHLRFPGIT
jgi:crossover junction endodeoxyribonuclease RuvC